MGKSNLRERICELMESAIGLKIFNLCNFSFLFELIFPFFGVFRVDPFRAQIKTFYFGKHIKMMILVIVASMLILIFIIHLLPLLTPSPSPKYHKIQNKQSTQNGAGGIGK
jgi:uncharacterized membrane protein